MTAPTEQGAAMKKMTCEAASQNPTCREVVGAAPCSARRRRRDGRRGWSLEGLLACCLTGELVPLRGLGLGRIGPILILFF
ncbi:uncharacterized protein DS421_10g305250 [Arachis hypogaea]|nr:uncharacterized protein DS421_10g305250 [Arachis hypogaea]